MLSRTIDAPVRGRWVILTFLFLVFPSYTNLSARPHEKPSGNQDASVWKVPTSDSLMPHFERVNERAVFFVQGRPFTVLAVEIPWWDLIYGRYAETMNAYDDLYPAAQAMGLNALKIPVKWSMVEPQKGVFDFSYVDHVKAMAEKYHLKLVLNWFGHYGSTDGNIYRNLTGEMFAPYDIVSDEKTYPRAIDADGAVHHNAASYEYPAVVEREVAAFRAFMEHLKEVDSTTHTILMIQVENEISVFGDGDRQNRKLWRDHAPTANRLFVENGFTDDLKYSAWRLSTNWIRPLTDAGTEVYPLPLFLNYVGEKLEDAIIGGSPGEDLTTYLRTCPHVAFIGVNLYTPPEASLNDFRSALSAYRLGRNLPAVTETNSDRSPVAPRLAYLALGEFGVPVFAPWALSTSSLASFQPYVLPDGSLGNGAFELRDALLPLVEALPQVSYYAGTEKLKVFMANLPGEPFSQIKDVNGFGVRVSGMNNGQAIVIHPSAHNFLVLGFRCWISFHDWTLEWPALRKIRVERGYFSGNQWKEEKAARYTVDQSHKTLNLDFDTPQVVQVSW